MTSQSLPLHDPAWVTAAGGVLVAVIGYIIALIKSIWEHRQTREAIRQVKHEVTNSHTVNLRDDLDGKHAESTTALRSLATQFDSLAQQLKIAEERRKTDQTTLLTKIEANSLRVDDTVNSLRQLSSLVETHHTSQREAQTACQTACLSRIQAIETQRTP